MSEYVGMRITLGAGVKSPSIKFVLVSAGNKAAARKQAEVALLTSSGKRLASATGGKQFISIVPLAKFIRDCWNGQQHGMMNYGGKGINPFTGQSPSNMKRSGYDGDPYEYHVLWGKLKPAAKQAATIMIVSDLKEKVGKEVEF